MISTHFLYFSNEFFTITEDFNLKQNYFEYDNFLFFFFFNDLFLPNFLNINEFFNTNLEIVIDFIDQLEEIESENLENIKSVYHYSIPNTKLSYPEPFIASATFMHSDLWFVHILIFQYWLWFIFVFLIVFFFVTFICVVRWCNMRIRPRRETRGVSRSKCGDLITACVPVSWATSIIVSESTDAIDYFDGFGTTEMVVGIRAYQWGWEYYYPKDLDLNYNIKNNWSSFVGNSLKYNSSSEVNVKNNNLWKFYQNKNLDNVITPAHLIILPSDNNKVLNFLNFSDIGASPINESAAFKKVRMFSKFSSLNLINPSFDFSSKYSYFFKNFFDKNTFLDSIWPGIKRQHNYLNNYSNCSNQSTFFDLKSITKVLNSNYDINFSNNVPEDLFFFNFFKKNNKFSTNSEFLTNFYNNIFLKRNKSNKFLSLLNFSPNTIDQINDDSDNNKYLYPIFKINKNIFKLNKLFELRNINNFFYNNELNSFNFYNDLLSFSNKTVSYKNYQPFGQNQSVSTSEKTLKNFASLSLNKSVFNFNSSSNQIGSYLNFSSENMDDNQFFYYNLSNSKWMNLPSAQRLFKPSVFIDYPHSPVISNNPKLSLMAYDNYKDTFIENTPTPLQGKEEQMPFFLLNIYWNFYWNNSNLDLKLKNNLNYFDFNNNFYMPTFTLYYDYDFRNWQTFELLEDSFWESSLSIYNLDEYINLVDGFKESNTLDKNFNFFLLSNKDLNNKLDVFNKPTYKDLNSSGSFYSNFFFIDDFVSPLRLLNSNSFFIFPLINYQTYWDDSFESYKFLNYYINLNFKSSIFSLANSFSPLTYSQVFDLFRSDYDDFSWYINDFNSFRSFDIFSENNIFNFKNYFLDINNLLDSNFNLNTFKTLRFTNNINLRSSVKSSMVTYNAIQKVFKSRFDEGRSNTNLNYLSNFYQKQLYLTLNRIKYENMLGKNKENFFKTNLFKATKLSNLSLFNPSFTSLNFYFFDFPFLLAHKSDASRYLWFDWYAKWGFYEVQPSSSSRYAIFGMPYFNKNFEFGGQLGDNILESENYLVRLARSRKNFLPNWSYNPFFYSKSNIWCKNDNLNEIYNVNFNIELNYTKYLLDFVIKLWNNSSKNYSNLSLFTPTNSGFNSYTRTSWQPNESISGYFFNISHLFDILTKREFIYRQLLESNSKIINLPSNLTASPSNPLIEEVKSAFLLIDPVSFNNEYSRNIYYSSLNYFNFNVLKNYISYPFEFLNLDLFVNYLFFYFFNYDHNGDKNLNNGLLKSQYRPLKKGITNMIRLHATGAIALPIEIRLQILASSKDVIHSWAIPSAGIKIDCVPGYSSHKVAIFLVSGIFWGQCMEICGRYHHWMPIVVYFMKRDLFFLWCTHFVFLSGSNDLWDINDRQYTNYVKQVSFDKSTWISELL